MPMHILHSLQTLPAVCSNGCAVTLGNFDGVHLGHQRLIGRTIAVARGAQVPSVIITFAPHPLRVMLGADAPPALMTLECKLDFFASLGVDFTLVLPFTREMANQSPEDFVRVVLVDALHTRHLLVGYDYAFGKDRRGNADLLARLGREHGFSLEQLEPVVAANEVVSSTRVRELLAQGDVTTANLLLNRPHTVKGVVEHGMGRGGRDLGFPTANLSIPPDLLLPPSGVYVVEVDVLRPMKEHACGTPKRTCHAVANVGVNPTFGGESLHLEVHIFDFQEDIYGMPMRVRFFKRLREERKFSRVDALIEQITADVARAKAFFAGIM